MLRARNRPARSACVSAKEGTILDEQSLAVRVRATPAFGDVSSDLWMADGDGSDTQQLTDGPAFYRRGNTRRRRTTLACGLRKVGLRGVSALLCDSPPDTASATRSLSWRNAMRCRRFGLSSNGQDARLWTRSAASRPAVAKKPARADRRNPAGGTGSRPHPVLTFKDTGTAGPSTVHPPGDWHPACSNQAQTCRPLATVVAATSDLYARRSLSAQPPHQDRS